MASVMVETVSTLSTTPLHRVAMYDMDRTITRAGTYSGFLMHVARRRQRWRLLLLPLVGLAGLAYAVRLVDRSQLKAFNLRLLVGRRFRHDEIQPLAESYAELVVSGGLYDAALEQIAADRADGYRILLATASFRLYVDAIARRLGIDDVLATELDVVDGSDHVHARVAGQNCYGPDKFTRITDWMNSNAIARDTAHIRAYSDHISDAPMLHFADEGVATTPSRQLRRLAPGEGWRVVDWRSAKSGPPTR